ncbi:MAG: hypothetical protein JW757_02170 [Anaerolineales bacterium]|nr:hypothetical protein [Anaerolineales bacterium]
MKILDYSPIPFNGGKLSLQERFKGITRFGFSWVSEMKSQEVVIEILGRLLDNRFTMLRNVPLPEAEIIIPLILLGPQGVVVINNSPMRGIYRASGDSWEIMDNRSRNFKATRPNLITRTLMMTRAFNNFLTQKGYALENDGILVFTDPGIHVNATRSDVRIILVDAVERFASRLLLNRPVMDVEDVRSIIHSLEVAMQPEEEPEAEVKIVPHQQVAQSVDSGFMQAISPLQKRANFSRRQWTLLGAFVLMDILILIAFLVFILWTA